MRMHISKVHAVKGSTSRMHHIVTSFSVCIIQGVIAVVRDSATYFSVGISVGVIAVVRPGPHPN
jgi:hypothetical protein